MKKNNFFRIFTILALSLLLGNWPFMLHAQITVTSFIPRSGPIGTTVTISGTNFNTTPSNNKVFFGAIAGTVSAASANTLTIMVPSGANYQDATVTDLATKLTAYAEDQFIITFPCGGAINSSSFGSKVDFTAGSSPIAVSVGDFNGDGKADLAIVNNADNTISLFQNTSMIESISFAPKTDFPTGISPQSIATGDLNGDGKLDLAVISNGSNVVSVFKNTSFGIEVLFDVRIDFPTGNSPQDVSIADMDGDGAPDIIVTNMGTNTISILRNTSNAGGISFAAKTDYITGVSPKGLRIGDVDGDKKPDIISANFSSGNVSVLRNTSTSGSISLDPKIDLIAGSGTHGVSIGDLDGDGKNDITVSNTMSNTLSVFRNTSSTGSISFAAKTDVPTGSAPMNVSIGDIDGDGIADLAVTNNTSNNISVFKNTSSNGAISLAPKVDFIAGNAPIGLSIGDLDGDGRSELLSTNSGSLSVMANRVFEGPIMTNANTVSICSGTSINLSLTFNTPSTYTWVASDNPGTTGERTTTQTNTMLNDTIINATSSAQTVTYMVTPTSLAESCLGTPQMVQVIVNPLPDANAGADTVLTCNNPTLTLTGTSVTSPVSYQWTSPDNTISNTQIITANSSGVYILTVTNSTTLCTNSDSMLVTFDTIAPIITCPLNYQITDCIPGTITINGTTNDITDSIKWFGPGIPTDNPALISNQNNYLLWSKRNSNGCISNETVTVTILTVSPIIQIPVNMDIIPVIPILDTLTCLNDSVLLNFSGSTSGSKIRIIRPSPMNDTVSNNTFTMLPGIYKATITDTITGCNGNALLFELKINVTLPQLIPPATLPEFNCSILSAVLNGTSGTPSSILNWTGPNNFSSIDPATVTQPGAYVFNVTDPANGCVKSDTLTLIYQNILLINGSMDTTICKGETVQINVAPLGGTPNFTYSWNNNAGNSASANVNPTDTTQYIVNVTDSAGCIGQDTIYVNVPAPIADSTLTFHLCDPLVPNGLIQIFASNGVLPYQYSITNGQSYQSSPIFLNLPFGNYPILIKDAMNCKHSDSATISTQSQKPRPDFIVNTNMMQADTFVVVDISNPRPDSVIWTFPSTVTVLDNNSFAPIIVSADTGTVDISMETHFGNCIMYLTKTIQFIKADTIATSPNGNGIEELTLFPNPNSGQFSIEVKLYKKQTFAIYVYNSQGIEQARVVIPESNYTLNAISIPNPIPGTYLLKVISEYDSKSKTIVVTQ